MSGNVAMINSELAHALDTIADLLEITGGDTFRINSYRRVARTIRDLTDDVRVLQEAGKLREIKGIGKGTAAKIEEFIESGTISALEELRARIPEGLPALLAIPGMGPKKVALVHEQLGVACLDDLKEAVQSGRLATLPGLGEQSVKRIADGITFLESSGDRTPIGIALPIARDLAETLRSVRGVERVEIAGSMRRGRETIGDVDLLCASNDGRKVVEVFTRYPRAKRVLAHGITKGSIIVETPEGRELQIDLRVVPAESFGAALQYFTGSKEHNVRLRELALRAGWKLNEWGLFEGDRRIAGATEEEIYSKLGLPFIPAEVREDRGELEQPERCADLITLADIRGDLHVHTTASDGKNSIEEMALAARDRGYEYIAITDHSHSSTIAGGLSIEKLLGHIKAIHAVNKQLKDIAVLAGTECDILSDGSLDYPDKVLAQCDFVVASIHVAMAKGKKTPTERTLAALENPYVNLIGHPSGRLINQRPAMALDIPRIAEAAASRGAALEVSASWQRLDLKDVHIQQAIEAGARISINTDAHRTTTLDEMELGIKTARRGYAGKADVINVMPLKQLRKWIKDRRARGPG